MATYWEFFVTNTVGAGGFTSAHADAAGGPRWGAGGAPILTATAGTAQFALGAPPGRTYIDRTSGNWGTTVAGDRVCLIVGSTRQFAEVTTVVNSTRIEIAGTYTGPPQPTEIRVGGVALTNSAANLKTFMQRMLAGTYLTPNAWRLNIHRSGTTWAPPIIDSTLSGIGPGHKALTMQGFSAAAGDLSNTENRPLFSQGGTPGQTAMLTLAADNTRIRFYDLDFQFQPVSSGYNIGADVISAVVVEKPNYTFCRCYLSVLPVSLQSLPVPVQVLRLLNAQQTVRTCWIVRPEQATPRIETDSSGTRTPSTCIYVTDSPNALGEGVATILGNLLDGPTNDKWLINCGIHLQSGNVTGGTPHQVMYNIFRKQPIAVFAETVFVNLVPLTCSPFSDPGVMRVFVVAVATEETFDEAEAA